MKAAALHVLHSCVDVCVCVCVCRGMQRVPKSTGCALSGFVLVKKVPGTLHFLPKSSGHSFDYHSINMSHQVGYMYYGNKPSPRRRQVCIVYCCSMPRHGHFDAVQHGIMQKVLQTCQWCHHGPLAAPAVWVMQFPVTVLTHMC